MEETLAVVAAVLMGTDHQSPEEATATAVELVAWARVAGPKAVQAKVAELRGELDRCRDCGDPGHLAESPAAERVHAQGRAA